MLAMRPFVTQLRQRISNRMWICGYILSLAVFLFPSATIAQTSSTELPAVEATEEDDDIDPNLVPLEPELTAVPPDAVAAGDKPQNPGDVIGQTSTPDVTSTQGADLSKAASGATAYNIPVVIDPSVQ